MAQTWFVKDGKNVYNKGVGMKVYVYKSKGDALAQSLVKSDILCVNHVEYNYFGELDLDIQPPKKTVRKEVSAFPAHQGNALFLHPGEMIPPNARNHKISYEVDE